MAIEYSALNLVPIREGEDEQTAINDMVNLAQHLDELSYERYWIAEHHNASQPSKFSNCFINSTYVRTYETHTCRFWRHHVT